MRGSVEVVEARRPLPFDHRQLVERLLPRRLEIFRVPRLSVHEAGTEFVEAELTQGFQRADEIEPSAVTADDGRA